MIEGEENAEIAVADSRITVQIIPKGEGFSAELFVKPFTEEPPYCKAGCGEKQIYIKKDNKTVKTERDFKHEMHNLLALKKELQEFDFTDQMNNVINIPSYESCLELLQIVKESDKYARIEWPQGVKIKCNRSVYAGDFSFVVKSKSNWFELSGELQVTPDMSVSLNELLEKLRQNKYSKFVEIKDGEFIHLTDELRRMISTFDTYFTKEKAALKIPEFIAPSDRKSVV